MSDEPRIERLIAMAERLIVVLEADIAALRIGKPQAMKTGDPDVQRLSAQYSREAQNFDPATARAAPPPLRTRFVEVTRKFREVLLLHARAVARVKNASEGMIRAIAEEVDRLRAPMRTYGRSQTPARDSGAMIFNKVV
jgi:hypothetical protein